MMYWDIIAVVRDTVCKGPDRRWCLTGFLLCALYLLTRLHTTPVCLTASLALVATWEGCECKQANKDGPANLMLVSPRCASSHSHNEQVTHVNSSVCVVNAVKQIFFGMSAIF